MSSGKRKGIEYSLQVTGIIGRDRKPKIYYFTLLETDNEDEVDHEALKTLIAQKLLDAKYKYGRLAVIKYPMLIDEYTSHSGKGTRRKTVETKNGKVVWQAQGYNMVK